VHLGLHKVFWDYTLGLQGRVKEGKDMKREERDRERGDGGDWKGRERVKVAAS